MGPCFLAQLSRSIVARAEPHLLVLHYVPTRCTHTQGMPNVISTSCAIIFLACGSGTAPRAYWGQLQLRDARLASKRNAYRGALM